MTIIILTILVSHETAIKDLLVVLQRSSFFRVVDLYPVDPGFVSECRMFLLPKLCFNSHFFLTIMDFNEI